MRVDFPFAGSAVGDEAYVVRWSSPSESDIATLQLVRSVTVDPATLWMGPTPREGSDATTYGFPEGALDGIWADLKVGRKLAVGSVQLNRKLLAAVDVVEGFSGSPVWAKRKERQVVIGMIAKVAKKAHASSLISSTEMSGQLQLAQHTTGSPGWSLKVFRASGLSQMLKDLRKLTSTGVPNDDVCDFIQQQLGAMEVSLGGLTDSALWPKSPYENMTNILAAYRLWNDAPRGSGGTEERTRHMKTIMDERSQISEKLRDGRGTIELYEDLEAEADNLLGALNALANTYPEVFPELFKLMQHPHAA